MGMYSYIDGQEIKLSRQIAEEARKFPELVDQIDRYGYCEMKIEHVKEIVIRLKTRQDLAENTVRKLILFEFWLDRAKDYSIMFT